MKSALIPLILIIGAPSLTGVDANDLVNKSLVDDDFPLDIKVTSHTAHDLIFPNRCHLKPCHDLVRGFANITVKSIDVMHRFVSDIEAIAELNKSVDLLEISANVVDRTVETVTVEPVLDAIDDSVAVASKKSKGG